MTTEAEGVALRDRKNQGVFLSGKTGSGKTRKATELAEGWERRIAVDPTKSIDLTGRKDVVLVRTYRDAAEYLTARWHKDQMDLVCRFTDTADYNRLFSQVYAAAVATEETVLYPTLFQFDEVDQWSSSDKIDRGLDSLIRYGRHYRISWTATARADVETHRTVRMNATQILAFKQGMLSTETNRMLKSAGMLRGGEVPHPATMQLWNVEGPAQEGVHFVALQDPYAEWRPTWDDLVNSQRRKAG